MSEKGSGRRSPDRDTGEWGTFPSAHTQVWCHNVRRHFSCCYAARVAHPGLLALFLFLRIVLSTRVHRIIYKRCSVMHHHLYSRPLIHKKKLLLDLFLTEESFLLLFFRFEITNKWFQLEIMITGPRQTLNKWCWCHEKESELPGDGWGFENARGLMSSAIEELSLNMLHRLLSALWHNWNRAKQTQHSCS